MIPATRRRRIALDLLAVAMLAVGAVLVAAALWRAVIPAALGAAGALLVVAGATLGYDRRY